ncbi:FecR family protein [Chitinophaga sp. GCM10012297]|uniref:FecR domain-containing protein n=1 Tax=Chitinophaga chungangae TaxID=2821488 RepID=A0ABS3YG97_9BACT|nr:FecR family protein [Chitinophaga chungangae]MBO9153697.1 FecR domain-containing protein [Chitinophaga chungangae]
MEQNASQRQDYLFQRYLQDTITGEEYAELWELLRRREEPGVLSGRLQQLWEAAHDAPPLLSDDQWAEKFHQAKNKRSAPLYRRLLPRVAAAVLILGAAGYLVLRPKPAPAPALTAAQEHIIKDFPPGGNKAVLTLADGSELVLDSAANGRLSTQGNISIVKLDSGRLAYQPTGASPGEVVYNTLSTPKGGQFQLLLPDGSRAWLNAGSSIRFPNIFAGGERKVDITGEVYFEVEKDAQKPFIVQAGGTRIDVLGTSFNVQAYAGAPMTATLLTGRVKVSRNGASVTLRPYQQALAANDGDLRLVNHADLEEVMAWKNGLFWLNGTDMASLAKQLSLWYDVEIIIKGNISQRFTGTIPRNVNVSKVFEVLQETGSLQYTFENGRIIVTP